MRFQNDHRRCSDNYRNDDNEAALGGALGRYVAYSPDHDDVAQQVNRPVINRLDGSI